jgi:hypothetical protein
VRKVPFAGARRRWFTFASPIVVQMYCAREG